MSQPSEHAAELRRIADRIKEGRDAPVSNGERGYDLASCVVRAGEVAIAMFADGTLKVDTIPWYKPGPKVTARDAGTEAERLIQLAASAKGMLPASDQFSMCHAYGAALIDLLLCRWLIHSFPGRVRMDSTQRLGDGTIEDGGGLQYMSVPKGMSGEKFLNSLPPPSPESTNLPICFQHYAEIQSHEQHFPATRANSDTYIEGVRLLAEQVDSAGDRRRAVAVASVRDVDTAENTWVSTIARPTRPVSVTHAAKHWFNCDPRLLNDRIKRGQVRAEQQSPKRLLFDLDEVVRLNPELDKDADPALYRKPKPANRRKKKPATRR